MVTPAYLLIFFVIPCRHFLSADVLSYYDLEEMGTAADAIRNLKFRQQGTLYTVVESDILVYKVKS